MTTGPARDGYVRTDDDPPADDSRRPLGRRLRPGPPRTLAAALLVLGAVASVAAWGVLAEFLGADRAGTVQLLLYMLQPLVAAVPVVAVAAFVLTGSAASRALGGLTAVAGLLLPFLPVASILRTLSLDGSDWSELPGLWMVPFAAVVVFYVAAVVALAVPASSRRR